MQSRIDEYGNYRPRRRIKIEKESGFELFDLPKQAVKTFSSVTPKDGDRLASNKVS